MLLTTKAMARKQKTEKMRKKERKQINHAVSFRYCSPAFSLTGKSLDYWTHSESTAAALHILLRIDISSCYRP